MKEWIGTLPPGMVTGSVYALLSMGLVLIYKATRIPNFAYGAMATFIACFHYRLVAGHRWGYHVNVLFVHLNGGVGVHLGFWTALPFSLAVAAALGWFIERAVIRPFARASTIVHIIVTLGLALLLQALTQQVFGANDLIVPDKQAIFSRHRVFSIGSGSMSWERIGVLLLVVVLAAAVYALFRFTATGLAIRAAATDRDVASLLGVSVRQLAVVSWVGGSMMAGIAGIALASVVVTSNPNLLLLLNIKGFAAAIVGGMTSFPIAVAAGFAIGWGEELVRHAVVHMRNVQGAAEIVTLGGVIITLALRPKWIFTGIREDEDGGVTSKAGAGDTLLARMIDPAEAWRLVKSAVPTEGRLGAAVQRFGKVFLVVFAVAVVAFPLLPLPSFWTLPANLALIQLLVVLSFVVVVGWLGQISLAQGAFLAVGGAGTAICATVLHLPFPLPIIGGVLFSVPVSILVGLPALRLRGLHLAVATLAFGLAGERAIVPRFTAATRVTLPSALDSDSARYWLSLVLASAAFFVAWRVSRTRVGRSFYAIRDSETVAAAYGIRPVRTKLTGFILSGAIAALAGSLITYQLGGVGTQYASVFFSISWLTNSVVAGIGSIAGPIIGALMFGLYPEVSKGSIQATRISFWPQIIGSGMLLVIMAVNPGGLATMSRFVRSRTSAWTDTDPAEPSSPADEPALVEA